MVKKISKPHPKWKTEFNEKDRESLWKEAAGKGKNPGQHVEARARFTRTVDEDAADAKNGVGLDDKETAP